MVRLAFGPVVLAFALLSTVGYLRWATARLAAGEARYARAGDEQPRAICSGSDGCHGNGACIDGQCECRAGFAGESCHRCGAAHSGYPACALDTTCYAMAWTRCGGEAKVFRNEGLLPSRPRRGLALSPAVAEEQRAVAGVQIVEGMWGADTVSLKFCWMLSCGSKKGSTRRCGWTNTTSQSVYLKNLGCTAEVARRPGRWPKRPGAGFAGECEDAAHLNKHVCTLPSKRYAVYTRDASWRLTRDADGSTVYLEAANWKGHFLSVDGLRPILSRGKPSKEEAGALRLYPIGDAVPNSCPSGGGVGVGVGRATGNKPS